MPLPQEDVKKLLSDINTEDNKNNMKRILTGYSLKNFIHFDGNVSGE